MRFVSAAASAGLVAFVSACGAGPTVDGEGSVGESEQAVGLLVTEDQKVFASDVMPYTSAGYEVDIDGDLAVLGTVYSNSAYVFEWNGSSWVEIQKLLPSSPSATSGYGQSVAVSGDTVAIGTGDAAYVYRRSGGTFVQEALVTSPFVSNYFANGGDYDSLDLDGDNLIVGDTYNNVAYIYSRSGSVWSLAQTLSASPAGFGFGVAVSIEGTRAIVSGAVSPALGAIYVFERSGAVWTQTAVLSPSDIEPQNGFAYEVDLSGDTIVSGGYFAGDVGSHSGKGYIFDYAGGSWSESAILLPSGVTAYSVFGSGVAVEGDVALVSSADATHPGGVVYMFLRSPSGWLEAGKLVAANVSGGMFDSVEISGGRAIAGNWIDNSAAQIGGSAFFYTVPTSATTCAGQPDGLGCDDGNPCTVGDVCTAGACAGSPGPDLDADGVCDAADNCPSAYNPSQLNLDANNYGDACFPTCIRVGDGLLGSAEDATIAAGQPNANFGPSTALIVGNSGGLRRSLIQFDLGFLPVQTVVSSAKLAMAVATNGGVSATVSAHNVLAPWSEASVTWGSFAGAYDPTPLGSFVNNVGLRRTEGLEALVDGWIQGTTPNNGLLLEADASPAATGMRSSDVPVGGGRPFLDLCFTVPGY